MAEVQVHKRKWLYRECFLNSLHINDSCSVNDIIAFCHINQIDMFNYSTLTSIDEPYPMLVLCGPRGSGKGYLSRKLVGDFPDFFGMG